MQTTCSGWLHSEWHALEQNPQPFELLGRTLSTEPLLTRVDILLSESSFEINSQRSLASMEWVACPDTVGQVSI